MEKRDKKIIALLGAAVPTSVMVVNLINAGIAEGSILAWLYLVPVICVIYPLSVFLSVRIPANHPYEVLLTSLTLPGLVLLIAAGLQLPK